MLSIENVKNQITKTLARSEAEKSSDKRNDRFIAYMMEQGITDSAQMHAALMTKHWCDNNK